MSKFKRTKVTTMRITRGQYRTLRVRRQNPRPKNPEELLGRSLTAGGIRREPGKLNDLVKTSGTIFSIDIKGRLFFDWMMKF
ncbi:hypothetical protein D4T97_005215 [Siminovitchia acidinfaciens]|uniref:Uncharacterized protein n=1 Tax=Siminovitchia acidinfaciens TaxID=2321395 RepID=A0A429Y434_9BACI|nr:hypothetical protein [Siminovitchia acidinfaciens]RST76184.1 hypothetical protein D4T97_005215 [Siminovitchia acidinfaciens]